MVFRPSKHVSECVPRFVTVKITIVYATVLIKPFWRITRQGGNSFNSRHLRGFRLLHPRKITSVSPLWEGPLASTGPRSAIRRLEGSVFLLSRLSLVHLHPHQLLTTLVLHFFVIHTTYYPSQFRFLHSCSRSDCFRSPLITICIYSLWSLPRSLNISWFTKSLVVEAP